MREGWQQVVKAPLSQEQKSNLATQSPQLGVRTGDRQ